VCVEIVLSLDGSDKWCEVNDMISLVQEADYVSIQVEGACYVLSASMQNHGGEWWFAGFDLSKRTWCSDLEVATLNGGLASDRLDFKNRGDAASWLVEKVSPLLSMTT
jgi:hypothetical protein